MPWNCCVPSCSATSKICKGLSFHSFPKEKKRRRDWIIAIRTGKDPSPYAKVCSRHFDENDFILRNQTSEISADVKCSKYLKPEAVPHLNLPVRKFEKKAILRKLPTYKDVPPVSACPATFSAEVLEVGAEEEIALFKEPNEIKIETVKDDDLNKEDVATQTALCGISKIILNHQILNEKQFKYYTGFTKEQFNVVVALLKIHCTKYKGPVFPNIDVIDQIFMTLYYYRHAVDFLRLEMEFSVNRNKCKNIVFQWSNILYFILKNLDFWEDSAKCVKEGEYTTIIDCTEIEIETPTNPTHQQIMWSEYKQRHTLKALIAVSENGILMFCSDLYGGSISDREIVKKCGILEKLKEGDTVLADKGFNISDILETRKVALNIPPFKYGKQLKESDVLLTRAIAKRRILVERIIGYIKFNKICKKCIPLYNLPSISQMFFNCSMLSNIKNGILQQ